MARKFIFVAATFLFVIITSSTTAQNCGGPVPVLSVYTTIDRDASFSFGTEFGSLSEDSPWGYSGGMLFTLKKEQTLNREKQTRPMERILPHDLTIYMKGSYRVFSSDFTSIHATVGAEMDSRSRFDVKPGVRLLFPVGDQVALKVEPVYSPRNQTVTGRVGFAIAF